MFNLEQAIADWREKMLAAGIETPVPLEELELHLREEIERQVRAGLNAQEAFEKTVRRIGEARALGVEFKKVSPPANQPNQVYDAVLATFALFIASSTAEMIYWHNLSAPEPLLAYCVLFRSLTVKAGQSFPWPADLLPWLATLNILYIAAMVATLLARRLQLKSAPQLTQLLGWALLPAFFLGTIMGIYSLRCSEPAQVSGTDKKSSRKLLSYTPTTTGGKNILRRRLEAGFRIGCGIMVGLVGFFMWMHSSWQLTSIDYGSILRGRSFDLGSLIIGPGASLILGLGSLLLGTWMIWCAAQIVLNPQTPSSLAHTHV